MFRTVDMLRGWSENMWKKKEVQSEAAAEKEHC